MNAADEKRVTKEYIYQLAVAAGLNLDDERLAALAPQVEKFVASIRRLNELAIGDVEPLTIFTLKED